MLSFISEISGELISRLVQALSSSDLPWTIALNTCSRSNSIVEKHRRLFELPSQVHGFISSGEGQGPDEVWLLESSSHNITSIEIRISRNTFWRKLLVIHVSWQSEGRPLIDNIAGQIPRVELFFEKFVIQLNI